MKRSDTLKMRLACSKSSNRRVHSDTVLYIYLNRFAVQLKKNPKLLDVPRRDVSRVVLNWMKKNVKGRPWKK